MFTRIFLMLLSILLPLTHNMSLAADSTSFNPLPVQVVSKNTGGGVPVGTIITWPVANNPPDMDKWLECNGQSVNAAVYPELAALIGGRVPDYRGLFLRGYGSQASNHYGYVTHSSGGLGQIQGDAIRNIYGGWSTPNGIHGSFGAMRNGGQPGNDHTAGGFTEWGSTKNVELNAYYIVPTAPENRPVNKAVRYLIRSAL